MRGMILMFTACCLAVLLGAGCSDNQTGPDEEPQLDGDGGTETDGGSDPGMADPGADDGGTTVSDGDDQAADDGDPTTLAARFPQAVDDAMMANPDVYPQIPLKIAVAGGPDGVTVSLDGADYDAASVSDGLWRVDLPISGLADDTYPITATATRAGSDPATADAELLIVREGVQKTVWGVDGPAGTPRLHWRGQELYLTWTAVVDDQRNLWMQRIDGAGRWVGEQILLVQDGEVRQARTAFGAESIGVLYHRYEGGYIDIVRFALVDYQGNQLMDPVDLQPDGMYNVLNGDITYDGSGYVMVYRVSGGNGCELQVLQWLRVDENTQQVTGPLEVASAHNDNDCFLPISFYRVAAIGDVSLVGFVQETYSSSLDMALLKSRVAVVDRSGTLIDSYFAGDETGWTQHNECRVAALGDQFAVVWSLKSLTDPDPNPPMEFFGKLADAQGALPAGDGTLMVTGALDRDEPFLLTHPDHLAVMAWTDNRSMGPDPLQGHIQLYLAQVDEDLGLAGEVIFDHARFIESTAELNAVTADSNVILTWIDERHGGSILNPRPEVYLETAW